MNQMDAAINEIKKINKIDSVILSWSYNSDGEGVLIMGRKNPLSMNSDMEILNAWVNDNGLEKLKQFGIELD